METRGGLYREGVNRRWVQAVAWWHGRERLSDLTMMVLCFVPMVTVAALRLWVRHDFDGRPPDVAFWLLAIFIVVPLAWRRSDPARVALIGLLAYFAIMMAGFGEIGQSLPAVILAHTLGNHVPEPQRSRLVRLLAAIGAIAVTVRLFGPPVAAGDLVVVAAFFRGQAVRNQRAYLAELLQRVETADALAAEEARRAMASERAAIARDLHDVVAHGMAVVVVQAGAARLVLDNDPVAARQALEHIEAAGRASLTDMRMLLGVLRDDREVDESSSSVVPQRGIADLAALVASVRDAGSAVTLSIDTAAMNLPEVVGVTMYRIVQEALTNTLKHAGPASVTIEVGVIAGEVVARVRDDGRGAAAPNDGSGHGLIGMAERVTMFHGELHAGPLRGGGFEVSAHLPFNTDTRAESRR